MMQFACPLAFAALLLPLIVWYDNKTIRHGQNHRRGAVYITV